MSGGSVFVTGALGFIGRHLADRLRAGGAQVRGVDLRADAGLDVVAGDISAPGAWSAHMDGCDTVVHTAALVSLRSGLDEFHRANVLGTANALAAAVTAGARRFVQLSSVTVFGNDYPDGVTEEHPVRLTGVPYVDTKIAGEQHVLQAHAEGRIEVTVVRPGDVYGPGSGPWLLTPLSELRRGLLMLPMGGRGIISPTYVEDLVEGIAAAAAAPQAAGQVITLAAAQGASASDYFGRIAAIAGVGPIRTVPTPVMLALAGAVSGAERLLGGKRGEANPGAVRYLTHTGHYSIEKARGLIGYDPATTLDEGMRRCEEWLLSEGIITGGGATTAEERKPPPKKKPPVKIR